jgi:hypothetical protein
LLADCETIKKAGSLGIQIDWGTRGHWENKVSLLEGDDGKADCTIKPL